ncbi:uncharacterized protein LOC111249132 [Varroa destructor]|uniref:Uncharacterized protein n=1 Tax=Varroa destructor TaxID=109461 RepID=A0A7M7JWU5_VARDE|nr:uncharacterized protein LOC111249132 [Varroa destructor]XP_022658296.1 uncharacterized protein LOC111249132 [Varroa destructor]XP_022658298.1 uncharacterized protein LOC111249132 [Varroa destructor]
MPMTNSDRDVGNQVASDTDAYHNGDSALSVSQSLDELSSVPSSPLSASSPAHGTPIRSNALEGTDSSKGKNRNFHDEAHNKDLDQAAEDQNERAGSSVSVSDESACFQSAASDSLPYTSLPCVPERGNVLDDELSRPNRREAPYSGVLQQLARVFQAELEFEVDYAEGDDDVDEDDEDTYIDIDSDDEYDDIDIYDSDGRTDHYEDSEKDDREGEFADDLEKTTKLFEGAHVLRQQVVAQLCCPLYQPQWFDVIDVMQEAELQAELGRAEESSKREIPRLTYHQLPNAEKTLPASWEGTLEDAVSKLYCTESVIERESNSSRIWALQPGIVTDPAIEYATNSRIQHSADEDDSSDEESVRIASSDEDETSESEEGGDQCETCVGRCVRCPMCCESQSCRRERQRLESLEDETESDDLDSEEQNSESDWETCTTNSCNSDDTQINNERPNASQRHRLLQRRAREPRGWRPRCGLSSAFQRAYGLTTTWRDYPARSLERALAVNMSRRVTRLTVSRVYDNATRRLATNRFPAASESRQTTTASNAVSFYEDRESEAQPWVSSNSAH